MNKTAYDEILDFITSSPTLEAILDFKHSPTTIERVDYLRERKDEATLTEAEEHELKEFARANELMAQLKIRAKRRLANADQ